jgi:hypothetical protein
MMQLDGVLHQHADERHRRRAASVVDANKRPQIIRTPPIDDRPLRDVADVIEERIDGVVRKSTHGWIEEHGGGLYSRLWGRCVLLNSQRWFPATHFSREAAKVAKENCEPHSSRLRGFA